MISLVMKYIARRMKLIFRTLAGVILLSGFEACAQAPTGTPPADQDPFVGHWRANAKKSRPKLSQKAGSYLRTIERSGDDVIFASSGGAAGPETREFRVRCDRDFHLLPAGPSLACWYVAPNRVEGETKYPKGEHDYWAREVSTDGQQLTISEYGNKTRSKIRSVEVLDRVK